MSLPNAATDPQTSLLNFVKEQSGRRIEQARRRKGMTQAAFAREVGLSMRWLREVEGGNPSSKLDDHLACAHRLELSTGCIFLPLLYFGHEMEFPRQLALGDLFELERRCIEFISERHLAQLTRQLTPRWRRSDRGVDAA